MSSSRNIQRFTPRRDIDLVNKGTNSVERKDSIVNTIPVDVVAVQRKPNFPRATQKLQPILVIFLLWLIIPSLKNRIIKEKTYKRTSSSFGESFLKTDTIIDILSDVSPYLGLQEQESINTIIGILEAANILSNVRAGTYQSPRILKDINLSMGDQDRKIEIVKTLKPYFPPDIREIIEKTIHTYYALNRVSGNIVRFSEALENGEKQSNPKRIAEVLEIINPLVPLEQQKRINQIQNLIKMYSTLESSQLFENWTQQEPEDSKPIETENSSYDNNENDSKQPEQKKDITDALKSTLDPEQSQALEMAIKLAQLLSQKSNENKNESE